MKYIIIFPALNGEEVYYCKTLEEVKQIVQNTCFPTDEIDKIRVFEIAREILRDDLGL